MQLKLLKHFQQLMEIGRGEGRRGGGGEEGQGEGEGELKGSFLCPLMKLRKRSQQTLLPLVSTIAPGVTLVLQSKMGCYY
jgi:hypothetical protein